MKMKLVQTRLGRIILHLWAFALDGKFTWHFAGIKREF